MNKLKVIPSVGVSVRHGHNHFSEVLLLHGGNRKCFVSIFVLFCFVYSIAAGSFSIHPLYAQICQNTLPKGSFNGNPWVLGVDWEIPIITWAWRYWFISSFVGPGGRSLCQSEQIVVHKDSASLWLLLLEVLQTFQDCEQCRKFGRGSSRWSYWKLNIYGGHLLPHP